MHVLSSFDYYILIGRLLEIADGLMEMEGKTCCCQTPKKRRNIEKLFERKRKTSRKKRKKKKEKREGRGKVAGVLLSPLSSPQPPPSFRFFLYSSSTWVRTTIRFFLPFLQWKAITQRHTHRLVVRAAFLNAVRNSRPNRNQGPLAARSAQLGQQPSSCERVLSTVKFVEAFPPATAAPRCRSLYLFFSPLRVSLGDF